MKDLHDILRNDTFLIEIFVTDFVKKIILMAMNGKLETES